MLKGKLSQLPIQTRSFFRRIFHVLLDWLEIRRFKEHSFFGSLVPQAAIVADCGAHRGEFFAALRSHYSISRALLVEANPALAESLKKTFAGTDVLHAALVGGNDRGLITFTRSTNPESSSIFSEWSAAYGIADQVEVPAVELASVVRKLGGRVDLVKFDIEGAEIDVLREAGTSDLNSCGQLTVEFHDKRPPLTRHDVEDVCLRMRAEGYLIVKPDWPNVDDVLFVNLKSMRTFKRIEFRCRVAVANALFIIRRKVFGSGYSS
jgi:FkbM family methyltransferase